MRNVTVILAGSGWGAGNFATADGAVTVLQHQLLNSLFEHPDVHVEVYYAQWHLNSDGKSEGYSIEQRRVHVLQSAYWVSKQVEQAVLRGDFVLVIGGDHSLAMGTWSGVNNAGRNFGLLWIDAHMDAHTYETTISNNPHGMPVAVLLGSGDREFVDIAKNLPILKLLDLYRWEFVAMKKRKNLFWSSWELKLHIIISAIPIAGLSVSVKIESSC